MTEHPQEPETTRDHDAGDDESPVESGSIRDDLSFVRPDNELEGLVNVANTVGLGMSMTLVTNGAVVSGNLIGYSQFWNETADLFEGMDVTDKDAAAGVRALAESYRKQAQEGLAYDEDDDEARWPPRYVHLKDAWVHDGAKYVNVGLWRGRMALVVGWSFGQSS